MEVTPNEKAVNFRLSDKIELALSCVNDRFISHVTYESWGDSILIMEKNGNAFGHLYWFHDDNTSVYLSWLSVNAKIRQQGMGTELQKLREEMGLHMGAKSSCLWVKKDTWMYNWYKRRGYEEWKDYDGEPNFIWMRKALPYSQQPLQS